jgi:succinate-acetate transporter protein
MSVLRRFLAVEMGAAFAAAFGTWLLLWCVFTFMLSWGPGTSTCQRFSHS